MRHLNEEELVERYYASREAGTHEAAGAVDEFTAAAGRHLGRCEQCAAAYEEIVRVLGAADVPEPPARPAGYGAQVWQAIRGPLPAYEVKRRQGWFVWPQWAYAAASLLLLAGTFYAGKLWERAHSTATQAGNAKQGAQQGAQRGPQQVKERVVLFVLDGHLDRSERLLVQLNHAGADEEPVALPLQAEARQLLSDNRLYRQSVAQAKDPLLAGALDHLERVLLEVANSPEQLSSEDVERIEKELNTDGLLFEIRVLRARVSEHARQKGNQGAFGDAHGKGRTIL